MSSGTWLEALVRSTHEHHPDGKSSSALGSSAWVSIIHLQGVY